MMLATLVMAAMLAGEDAFSAVPLGANDGERFLAGRFNGHSLGLSEGPSVARLVGSLTRLPAFGVVAGAPVALPWRQ